MASGASATVADPSGGYRRDRKAILGWLIGGVGSGLIGAALLLGGVVYRNQLEMVELRAELKSTGLLLDRFQGQLERLSDRVALMNSRSVNP